MASLRFSAIWSGFWAEPWSFKWTCLYVFFEYVRPQQVYEWLQGPPYALVCIGAAVLAFALEGLRFRSKSVMNWLMLAFTMVVLLSSVFASYPEISFSKLNNYVNWIIAFVLIANSASNERRWFLFILLFMLWNTKMSQHGFRSFLGGSWGNGGAPGWFRNSGEFALEMCLFIPIAFHFMLGLAPRLTRTQLVLLAFLPVSAVLSVVAAGSRGGQLALACVGLWMLMRSRSKVRGLLVLAVVTPLIWLVIPQSQKDRFQDSGTDQTSLARIAYWKAGREMAKDHPFLGVGYENWVPYYSSNYAATSGLVERLNVRGQRVVEVSHNSFIEVMSQLGYTGLALFCALLGAIWYVNGRTRRVLKRLGERGRFMQHMSLGLDAGVVGFAVAGFFMAVAFYPFLWFQLAMTAGLHAAALALAQGTSAGSDPLRAPMRAPMQAPRSWARVAGAPTAGWRNPHVRPSRAVYTNRRASIDPRPEGA
jgi:O-antigen ligase